MSSFLLLLACPRLVMCRNREIVKTDAKSGAAHQAHFLYLTQPGIGYTLTLQRDTEAVT